MIFERNDSKRNKIGFQTESIQDWLKDIRWWSGSSNCRAHMSICDCSMGYFWWFVPWPRQNFQHTQHFWPIQSFRAISHYIKSAFRWWCCCCCFASFENVCLNVNDQISESKQKRDFAYLKAFFVHKTMEMNKEMKMIPLCNLNELYFVPPRVNINTKWNLILCSGKQWAIVTDIFNGKCSCMCEIRTEQNCGVDNERIIIIQMHG